MSKTVATLSPDAASADFSIIVFPLSSSLNLITTLLSLVWVDFTVSFPVSLSNSRLFTMNLSSCGTSAADAFSIFCFPTISLM